MELSWDCTHSSMKVEAYSMARRSIDAGKGGKRKPAVDASNHVLGVVTSVS